MVRTAQAHAASVVRDIPSIACYIMFKPLICGRIEGRTTLYLSLFKSHSSWLPSATKLPIEW